MSLKYGLFPGFTTPYSLTAKREMSSRWGPMTLRIVIMFLFIENILPRISGLGLDRISSSIMLSLSPCSSRIGK